MFRITHGIQQAIAHPVGLHDRVVQRIRDAGRSGDQLQIRVGAGETLREFAEALSVTPVCP